MIDISYQGALVFAPPIQWVVEGGPKEIVDESFLKPTQPHPWEGMLHTTFSEQG